MNILHFDGHLGKDAELRSVQSGEKVLSFSVPLTSGYGDRKKTDWIDCAIWGARAEKLAPYLKKGTSVSIAGELSTREFTRNNGEKDKGLSVRVIEVSLHGGKESGEQRQGGTRASPDDYQRPLSNERGGSRGGGKPVFDPDMDTDIPF